MRRIIIALVILSSCSKSGNEGPAETTPVTVLEPLSNLPIKDARVILFECTAGCVGSVSHFTGLTDANGVCNVPSKSFNNSLVEMNIYKDGYWPYLIPAQRSKNATLTPFGWMRLTIHTDSNLPLGSKLLLNVGPKRLPYGSGDLTDRPAIKDTVLVIKGYGGEKNVINWQLVSAGFELISDGSFEVDIPRFDTLDNATLNY